MVLAAKGCRAWNGGGRRGLRPADILAGALAASLAGALAGPRAGALAGPRAGGLAGPLAQALLCVNCALRRGHHHQAGAPRVAGNSTMYTSCHSNGRASAAPAPELQVGTYCSHSSDVAPHGMARSSVKRLRKC
jgi:hypothetical protein